MKTAPLLTLALLALATAAHAQFGSLRETTDTPPVMGPHSVHLEITDADVAEGLLPALTAAMNAGPGRAKALAALERDAAKGHRYCVVTRTLGADFMPRIKSTYPVTLIIPFADDAALPAHAPGVPLTYLLHQSVTATLSSLPNGSLDVDLYLEEHPALPPTVTAGPLSTWSGQTNTDIVFFPQDGTQLIGAVSTGGGVTHAVYVTATVSATEKSDTPKTGRGF